MVTLCGNTTTMTGQIAAIFRHPVKGFTPEQLLAVDLAPGRGFPADRIYAVEDGPSGFNPDNPGFIPKQKFTVLMTLPRVAAARTAYDEATGAMRATAEGLPMFVGAMTEPAGREAFAAWLSRLLGDEVQGPLRVVEAPGEHRFTDHPLGQVSIVNLASVRDLEARIGREIDPLRFRANLYVEGWPAWAENGWAGRQLMLGWARAEVFKPIVRCLATHVDPTKAERDIDVTKALFDNYGHVHCGVYVRVSSGGRVGIGDAATAPADPK